MDQSGSRGPDTAVCAVFIFRVVLNETTLLSEMTFYNTAATVCQLVSAFYLMGNPRLFRVLKHSVIGGFSVSYKNNGGRGQTALQMQRRMSGNKWKSLIQG